VRFQNWLQKTGAADTVIDDLTLVIYEALANAVEHAYPPGHPAPTMRLRAQLYQDQVLITVSDQGCWRVPGPAGYRGRGLPMMQQLVTELHVNPTARGTTVRLRAPLTRINDGAAHVGPSSGT
jgi:serine/threonine-protein kinase RsbW